jgi:sugar lactone lactonase YvrE
MIPIDRLTDPICSVGESPLWRGEESALYWVDITGKRVHRLHLPTSRHDAWTTAEMVACIALGRNGTLIAGMETGIFSLSLQSDGVVAATPLASLTMPMVRMRFNDGRCDRQGRFWAGTMHMDMAAAHAVGSLYRMTCKDGLSAPAVTGLLTQNGLAWSPDGKRMYLSDSHPHSRQIWQFDYDVSTGTPGNRRHFVDMSLYPPGRPDGAAVDTDGCYWTCANDAGQLLRFTPQGVLDRAVELPVRKPAMCAFGGPQMDTLFVTSIRPSQQEDLIDQPLAGAVFALRPGYQGIPESEFGMHA